LVDDHRCGIFNGINGLVNGRAVNPTAKVWIEAALLALGADHVARAVRRGRTLVLAYHGIVPAGEPAAGLSGLHLPQRVFADQLEALLTTHDVVPLSAIWDAPQSARPRVAITFDDAYRGAMTAGLDELARRGLPATVFVAPGLLGQSTWWDRLADPVSGHLPDRVAAEAFTTCAGLADRVLSAFGKGADDLPRWAQIASEDEVRAVASRPGLTLGAHTWNHPNLSALDPGELAHELEQPRQWLAGIGMAAMPWLAYPYGLTSPVVVAAATAAGYRAAFMIDGGWLPARPTQSAALPRLNIPSSLTPAGFKLRIAGLITG
jgi:peptidoglycan/xylan/chitin deacetylase (PgdA/CDA1 family)